MVEEVVVVEKEDMEQVGGRGQRRGVASDAPYRHSTHTVSTVYIATSSVSWLGTCVGGPCTRRPVLDHLAPPGASSPHREATVRHARDRPGHPEKYRHHQLSIQTPPLSSICILTVYPRYSPPHSSSRRLYRKGTMTMSSAPPSTRLDTI